jgi:hypothetical protein
MESTQGRYLVEVGSWDLLVEPASQESPHHGKHPGPQSRGGKELGFAGRACFAGEPSPWKAPRAAISWR